ncbi:hypothetical protein Tco_1460859, partial [Tanacetum coccineum]
MLSSTDGGHTEETLSRRSTHSGPSPTTHTSAVRNTAGREKGKLQENPNEPASDATLREFCDRNYNQLLPILTEKMHQEKMQQEKLKAVKARLNFEEVSQYSESGGTKREKGFQGDSHTTAVEEKLKANTRVPTQEEWSPLLRDITIKEHTRAWVEECQKVRIMQEDTGSLNLRRKGQVWRTRTYPNHGYARRLIRSLRASITLIYQKGFACLATSKTYDGSEDPEDHLKIFQAVAKVERWAMPTWCHMFNSTLTGNARVWFDDLLPKCIKDPVEIHHIKQKEGESTKDFVRRFKIESRDVKGAPKVMRISGFM